MRWRWFVAALFCLSVTLASAQNIIPERSLTQDAIALANQGRLKEALELFLKHVENNPDDPRGHNNVAVTFMRLSRYDDARRALEKSLTLDPGNSDASSNLQELDELLRKRSNAASSSDDDDDEEKDHEADARRTPEQREKLRKRRELESKGKKKKKKSKSEKKPSRRPIRRSANDDDDNGEEQEDNSTPPPSPPPSPTPSPTPPPAPKRSKYDDDDDEDEEEEDDRSAKKATKKASPTPAKKRDNDDEDEEEDDRRSKKATKKASPTPAKKRVADDDDEDEEEEEEKSSKKKQTSVKTTAPPPPPPPARGTKQQEKESAKAKSTGSRRQSANDDEDDDDEDDNEADEEEKKYEEKRKQKLRQYGQAAAPVRKVYVEEKGSEAEKTAEESESKKDKKKKEKKKKKESDSSKDTGSSTGRKVFVPRKAGQPLRQRHHVEPLPRIHISDFFNKENAKYAAGELPFILTGAMKSWKLDKMWTIPALINKFGESIVDFYPHNMHEPSVSPYLVPLKQALAELIQPSGSFPTNPEAPGTYVQWNINPTDWARLSEDMAFLPYAFERDSEWLETCLKTQSMIDTYTKKVHWRMMLIGSRGAGMFNHKDVLRSASWQAQVHGSKMWHICAPDQEIGLYSAGEVDGFAPDYDKYPRALNLRCYQDELQRGEMMFYPMDYWHQTENTATPTLSISGTILDQNNYREMWGEMNAQCTNGKYNWNFGPELCDLLRDCYTSFWDARYNQNKDRGKCRPGDKHREREEL